MVMMLEQAPPRPAPAAAPEQWVEKHGDYLYGYAMTRLKNPEAVEELVQETFLAALRARKRFSGRSTERTWLVGILKHKIVDRFRARIRERPATDIRAWDHTDSDVFDDEGRWRTRPNEWEINPEKVLESREFLETFQHCLDSLPRRMAHVFSLREIDKLSTAEICRTLNITPTNLGVLLHRARLKLRSLLSEGWLREDSAPRGS